MIKKENALKIVYIEVFRGKMSVSKIYFKIRKMQNINNCYI